MYSQFLLEKMDKVKFPVEEPKEYSVHCHSFLRILSVIEKSMTLELVFDI